MSTLKVNSINNVSASAGGISIDSSGNVSGSLPSPNRNLLYNGAMQVSQRGTSTASITTSGYYTADRWQVGLGSLGTWTQDIQVDAPTGSGFRNSFRMLCTTADAAPAAGDTLAVIQILEGQDLQRIRKGTSSAQKLTLSFWVKSNVTGTYVAELRDLDNTRVVCATYSVSASATWERKIITFPADTTGAFDNDNAGSLQFTLWLGAGSNFTSGTLSTTWATTVSANRAVGQTNLAAATNNYWQVTGVQLETGDVATDFEFKSYGRELRECQRYYYRLNPTADTKMLCSAGRNFSSTQSQFSLNFPVVMRTEPSALEQTGTSSNYSVRQSTTNTALSAVPTHSGATTSAVAVFNTTVASGLTDLASVFLWTNAAGGAYLGWSAEL